MTPVNRRRRLLGVAREFRKQLFWVEFRTTLLFAFTCVMAFQCATLKDRVAALEDQEYRSGDHGEADGVLYQGDRYANARQHFGEPLAVVEDGVADGKRPSYAANQPKPIK